MVCLSSIVCLLKVSLLFKGIAREGKYYPFPTPFAGESMQGPLGGHNIWSPSQKTPLGPPPPLGKGPPPPPLSKGVTGYVHFIVLIWGYFIITSA